MSLTDIVKTIWKETDEWVLTQCTKVTKDVPDDSLPRYANFTLALGVGTLAGWITQQQDARQPEHSSTVSAQTPRLARAAPTSIRIS